MIYYTFNNEDSDPTYAYELDVELKFWLPDYDLVAALAAEDYYNNHDGWELVESWNGNELPITLYNENKQLIGTFSVYLEFSPHFTAVKVG